ncbi:MAG: PhoU domain-containing protein [Eubacteriales bacterium]
MLILSLIMTEKLPDKFLHVCKMGVAAMKMVTDSVNAYVDGDLELARQIIRDDDVVEQSVPERGRGGIGGCIRDGAAAAGKTSLFVHGYQVL